MTLALGTMGLFGTTNTDMMSKTHKLVNEAMASKIPAELLSKEQLRRYLDAFEIVGAVQGLDPKQQATYRELLKYC
ncbi:MAG: hypothetical protein IKF97_05085 [Clostridia bacterium]|nr:hypothetical protein [Clostridia bacterium]